MVLNLLLIYLTVYMFKSNVDSIVVFNLNE